jgi:4'-phosphopantetheinyl transferase
MNISHADFSPTVRMNLPEDEVHLWQVDLAAVAAGEQRWRKLLSPDERERAARFHFSRDRQNFTATRALLRTILASYVDSEPEDLAFQYSEKEKPSLASSNIEPAIEFNVSHSGTRALLAFARGRALGVDVEQIRVDFDSDALARRFFSAREQSQLATLAASERYTGFFRCWTRKEAYIKARGMGLSLPLDEFDVSLQSADGNLLLATRPDETDAALWSLQEVPISDGYVAALCVQGHGWRLKS